MAKSSDRPKASPPRLWGWTPLYSAIRDIHDHMIASHGGKKFVPRPKVPGYEERWRRKDKKLQSTVAKLTGQ